jgi:hypothetical protein
MKRLVFGSLSFFLLASASMPAVRAEPPSENPYPSGSPVLNTPSSSQQETEPFNLVGLAYQGYFEDQGIPSAQTLITAYRSGDISAEDVVKGAIQANRLSPEVLKDAEYIGAVDNQLNALSNND